jgi:hypothetical protein
MKAADVPRTHDRSAACGTSCFANVCMPILNPLDVAGTAQPPGLVRSKSSGAIGLRGCASGAANRNPASPDECRAPNSG